MFKEIQSKLEFFIKVLEASGFHHMDDRDNLTVNSIGHVQSWVLACINPTVPLIVASFASVRIFSFL
jgi:hypothetical protein